MRYLCFDNICINTCVTLRRVELMLHGQDKKMNALEKVVETNEPWSKDPNLTKPTKNAAIEFVIGFKFS